MADAPTQRRLIGQVLQKLGFCTAEHVNQALAHQKNNDCLIGESLILLGIIDQVQLAKGLAKQNGVPFVDLSKGKIPEGVLSLVPRDVADENGILPVKDTPEALIVASAGPLDPFMLDNLRFTLNRNIKWAIAAQEDFDGARKRAYGEGGKDGKVHAGISKGAAAEAAAGQGDDAPIIRLVQKMIADAVKLKASDIHVEPFADDLRVRYRIDGLCHKIESPPKNLQSPILSRLKLMANMDLSEKRKPQDGRIKFTVEGKSLDLRVSALPAYHGESIVMRILDREESLVSLAALGFAGRDYERFKSVIKRPNGIFLVTGPTGSGKTTTLYAALQELNKPDVKIITVEDPVEYNIPRINQCQVHKRIGLDFARVLRAMLRQAPNIILVGEIRDRETAEIAIQAALTGHLVFSTLHTNDAPSALSRLIDMGVKPFLVSSAIQAIMAQRLVRKLCRKCKKPVAPNETELRAVGLSRQAVAGAQFFGPVGCDDCMGTGYKGRLGVFEMMEMSPQIRKMVFDADSMEKIRQESKVSGAMTSLQEDGVRKAIEGLTTIDEILRTTQRVDIGK